MQLIGYPIVALALLLTFILDRRGLSAHLFRDLLLIALDIVLVLAGATPSLLSRFVFKEQLIRFGWRSGKTWTKSPSTSRTGRSRGGARESRESSGTRLPFLSPRAP
jgi:hypothetical protein